MAQIATQSRTSNKVKAGIAGVAVAALLAVGGSMAYFSDYETADDTTYTYGKVDVQLNNPQLNQAATVLPNQVIKWRPNVENIGEDDAYVFAKVTVPYARTAHVAADNGVVATVQNKDLLEFTANSATDGNKWLNIAPTDADMTQMKLANDTDGYKGKVVIENNATEGKVTYLFAYTDKDGKMVPVKKGDTNKTLNMFEDDEVHVANIVDQRDIKNSPSDLMTATRSSQIEVFAIQVSDINGHGTVAENGVYSGSTVSQTDPIAVWSVLNNQDTIGYTDAAPKFNVDNNATTASADTASLNDCNKFDNAKEPADQE